MQHSPSAFFAALAILAVAAALSALLIVALRPWLARYAVAKPNARSSHQIDEPQYVFSFLGILPWPETVISLTLCGATLGFAFFNRPVAKLFLGDVGSLPIGLVLGWLLIVLAGNGHVPRRYCCRCTTSPIALLRCCAGRQTANRFGRRTDRTFISAPPTTAFVSSKWSPESLPSISCWRRWRSRQFSCRRERPKLPP
jgi:hypothetical protein